MADDRDELIRSRAYELWEAEGMPHGRHGDHWEQASREIAEAQDEAAAEPIAAEVPDATPKTEPAPGRRSRKAATAPAAPKGKRKKDG